MIHFNPYNLSQDINNHKRVASKTYGTVNKMFLEGNWGEKNTANLKKFIEKFSANYEIDFEKSAVAIEEKWSKIADDVIKKMEEIFKVKLFKDVEVYFTTNDLATYSYTNQSFFVFILADDPIYYIIHELFHLYTYERFKKRLKFCLLDKRYAIMESMTKILNLEFLKYMKQPEKGKQGHDAYRILVSNAWTDSHDIEKVFRLLYQATEPK